MKTDIIYIDRGAKLTVFAKLGFDAHGNMPSKADVTEAAKSLKKAFPGATIVVTPQNIETILMTIGEASTPAPTTLLEEGPEPV